MSTEDRDVAGPAEPLAAVDDVLDSGQAGGKIIRGGAVRTASYVGGILLGLVSTPFMVRHLGVVDFGLYITVTSLIFIVAGLTEGGLTSIGVREYAVRDDARRARLMRQLLGLRVVLTGAGVIAALCWVLLAGYANVVVVGTVVSGFGLLLANYHGAFYVPLSVRLRLGTLALIDIFRQALTAAFIILLVLVGASLGAFFWVSVAVGALTIVLVLVLVRGTTPLLPSFSLRGWGELLRESLPFAAAMAVGVLYFRVAVILMSVVASGYETGLYSLGFRIIELVSGVPWLLISAALPILTRAARADAERMQYTMQRLFEVSLILGTWVAIGVGLGSPFAIEVVGGSKFDDAVPVLSILAVGMVGTFLVATWSHGLLSLRRNRALLFANLLALCVGVGLTLVLAPDHGAVGGAIATTATEFVLAATYAVLLVRGRRDLRPSLSVVPRVVLAAALAVGPMLLLGPPSVVAAVVASAVFFAVLLATRALPPEVIQALRRRV
jgi:O-antigen/teichoic acid export membrane protein